MLWKFCEDEVPFSWVPCKHTWRQVPCCKDLHPTFSSCQGEEKCFQTRKYSPKVRWKRPLVSSEKAKWVCYPKIGGWTLLFRPFCTSQEHHWYLWGNREFSQLDMVVLRKAPSLAINAVGRPVKRERKARKARKARKLVLSHHHKTQHRAHHASPMCPRAESCGG